MQDFMTREGMFALHSASDIARGETAEAPRIRDEGIQVRSLPAIGHSWFCGSLVTLVLTFTLGCSGGPPADEATIRLQSGAYKDGYSSTAAVGSKLDPKVLRQAAEGHYKPADAARFNGYRMLASTPKVVRKDKSIPF